MRIGRAACVAERETVLLSAECDTSAGLREIWFRAPEGPVTELADPFLVAALVPAMSLGESLRVEGTVSSQLLRGIPTLQEIFSCWDPRLKPVRIEVEAETNAMGTGGRGAAAFLSGGVDSFYTVLKHLDSLDALITIHGLDIPLEQTETRAGVSRSLREAAAELGKPLLEIETNLRSLLEDYYTLHGLYSVVLAAVGLFLSPRFHTVYVASSQYYSEIYPWNTHPLLDPLWSTEATTFAHDGADRRRIEKVDAIAGSDTALGHLRVCWNPARVRNCGHCEKCVRTLIELELAGALDRCDTFDLPLDLDAVARTDVTDLNPRYFSQESLAIAEARGHEPLKRALREALGTPAVPPRRYREEIQALEKQLAETQNWALELRALVLAQNRELTRWRQFLPVRVLRRILHSALTQEK